MAFDNEAEEMKYTSLAFTDRSFAFGLIIFKQCTSLAFVLLDFKSRFGYRERKKNLT